MLPSPGLIRYYTVLLLRRLRIHLPIHHLLLLLLLFDPILYLSQRVGDCLLVGLLVRRLGRVAIHVCLLFLVYTIVSVPVLVLDIYLGVQVLVDVLVLVLDLKVFLIHLHTGILLEILFDMVHQRPCIDTNQSYGITLPAPLV